MQNKIQKKYLKLIEKQKSVDKEIELLQQECTHPMARIKPESDTGNWSRSDDSYSVEIKCPECGIYKYYDSQRHPEMYRYWMGKR